MKILIIGFKGMLGQYLVEILANHEIIAWDKEELDITNRNQVNTKIIQLRPKIIINCAAYNNVDGAESNVELVNLINGYAVGYLAQAAKKIGGIIIHFSTGYVFNDPPLPVGGRVGFKGYSESDEPDPQSAYGASKLLGEQELQKYANKFYLIRTSRLFGKQGIAENTKKPFVELIIETAEKNNYKIKAVDEEYDLPTYGLDLANKVKEMLEGFPLDRGDEYVSPLTRGVGGVKYGIYHISNSGEPCTWYGFAREIFKIKKMPVEIEPVDGGAFGKRPAKRPMFCALKNTKLKPLRIWQEALKDYLKM